MNSFNLKWEKYLEDIKSDVFLFVHKKTGAEVIFIKNEDTNRSFGTAFKTLPTSNNGVAHILEHSVLSGSKKYPAKDPFSLMLKTTLYTFLNAITYRDKTIYPVSSDNEKSFDNLVDVYLDTLFDPVLSENTFKQQGWRYSLSDPKKDIIYSGVVFNEMKGAYSDPHRSLYSGLDKSLFPDNVYHFESGGDPEEITKLTYDEFLNFYKKHYHPSNSHTLIYGDVNTEKYLEKLNEYFDSYEKSNIPHIEFQKRFSKQANSVEYYSSEEDYKKKRGYLGIGFVLDIEDKDRLDVEILSYLLFGSPASYLRKGILESGLCEDIINFGYYGGYNQPTVYLGFSGVSLDKFDELKKLFWKLLEESKGKLTKSFINSGINKLEFLRSEADFGGEPRGIVYFDILLDYWLHNKDPLLSLEFKEKISQLRSLSEDLVNHFASLLQINFIDNKHSAILELKPSDTLLAEKNQAELLELSEYKNSLSAKEIEELVEATKKFDEWNTTPDSEEAISSLPKLSLNDVNKRIQEYESSKFEISKEHIFLFNNIPTNEILYFDISYNFLNLPVHLMPYVSIYGKCIKSLGTEKHSILELGEIMDSVLGGFYYDAQTLSVYKTKEVSAYLTFSAKMHFNNLKQGFDLISEMLLNPNFSDLVRLKALILEEKSYVESRLVENGHMFALCRSQVNFGPVYDLREKISNISYLIFLRDLEKRINEGGIEKIRDELSEVHNILITSSKVISATCFKDKHNEIAKYVKNLVGNFEYVTRSQEYRFKASKVAKEAFIISSQVNFVSESFVIPGVEYQGYMYAITRELYASYLWQKVRSEGGAYGAGVRILSNDMLLSTFSYRDPNIQSTFNVYNEMGSYLKSFSPTKDQLNSLIIGASNVLNPYRTPREIGEYLLTLYLTNTTLDVVQERLDSLLKCNTKQINQFGEFLLNVSEENKAKTILGNGKQIAEFNENKDFNVVTLS